MVLVCQLASSRAPAGQWFQTCLVLSRDLVGLATSVGSRVNSQWQSRGVMLIVARGSAHLFPGYRLPKYPHLATH